MGFEPAEDREHGWTPGGEPRGGAARAWWMVLALAALLATAVPVAGQRSATGGAFVRVPPVSELDVETASLSAENPSGLYRIRVRANHAWKVVLAAPVDAEAALWVRASGAEGSVITRRLDPGMETVVAAGEGGESVVDVEVRWEGTSARAAAVPFTYTLASL